MKEREKDYSYNYLFSVYFFNFKKKKGLAVRSSPHPPQYVSHNIFIPCQTERESTVPLRTNLSATTYCKALH